jgi:hypothetical protein
MKSTDVPSHGLFVFNGHKYLIETVEYDNEIINLIDQKTGQEETMFYPNIELGEHTFFVSPYTALEPTTTITIKENVLSDIRDLIEHIRYKEADDYETYVSSFFNTDFEIGNSIQYADALNNPSVNHIYKTAELLDQTLSSL